MTELHEIVGSVQSRIIATQANITEIKSLMSTWKTSPLFERSESKKDSILNLENRIEKVNKRYSEIKTAATTVEEIVAKNCELFKITDTDAKHWQCYVNFIDKIIRDSLFYTIGCSLAYLSEHMDPENELPPLFVVQMHLQEKQICYIPSLNVNHPENFSQIVNSLSEDIINMAVLVPRLSQTILVSYLEEISDTYEIKGIQNDLEQNVANVISQVDDFCRQFERYAYLWYENRKYYMRAFLMYSRQLTQYEQELVQANDSSAPQPSAPKLEKFREQVSR